MNTMDMQFIGQSIVILIVAMVFLTSLYVLDLWRNEIFLKKTEQTNLSALSDKELTITEQKLCLCRCVPFKALKGLHFFARKEARCITLHEQCHFERCLRQYTITRKNNMTDEKDTGNLTELLTELEHLAICFARNAFRHRIRQGNTGSVRNLFARTSFSQSEIKFMFFFFDCLDNIPDLFNHLRKVRANNEIGISGILLKVVSDRLRLLHGLITEKSVRKECGITDTYEIKAWTRELSRMAGIIPRICKGLSGLSNENNLAEQGERKNERNTYFL